jgi:hypothetical protein
VKGRSQLQRRAGGGGGVLPHNLMLILHPITIMLTTQQTRPLSYSLRAMSISLPR